MNRCLKGGAIHSRICRSDCDHTNTNDIRAQHDPINPQGFLGGNMELLQAHVLGSRLGDWRVGQQRVMCRTDADFVAKLGRCLAGFQAFTPLAAPDTVRI